ncbi:leukocyte surface antigen CD53-like [Zophobas morio]|uniref:leukocyte surface antigen CD53-like n=1 Tax=Zophobas morio TaxID=2755281 RepID=UPI003082C706
MKLIPEFEKYLLLVFNFTISACAITLIAFGVHYYIDENYAVSDMSSVFSLGIFTICVGVIIVFSAIFGCYSALEPNMYRLAIYSVILIIIFVLQLTLGVVGVVKIIDENDFLVSVRDILIDLFRNDNREDIKSFRTIQSKFECCGVNNYTDYDVPPYPSSCCGRTNCYLPYKIGCAEALKDALSKYIQIIAYVAISFAIVEGIGVFFVCLKTLKMWRNQKDNSVAKNLQS